MEPRPLAVQEQDFVWGKDVLLSDSSTVVEEGCIADDATVIDYDSREGSPIYQELSGSLPAIGDILSCEPSSSGSQYYLEVDQVVYYNYGPSDMEYYTEEIVDIADYVEELEISQKEEENEYKRCLRPRKKKQENVPSTRVTRGLRRTSRILPASTPVKQNGRKKYTKIAVPKNIVIKQTITKSAPRGVRVKQALQRHREKVNTVLKNLPVEIDQLEQDQRVFNTDIDHIKDCLRELSSVMLNSTTFEADWEEIEKLMTNITN